MSSCSLQSLVSVREFQSIQNFLFSTADPEMESTWEIDGWGDDWEIERMDTDSANEKQTDKGWMRECKVAISPNVDYMCVSHQDKSVFLHNKSSASDGGTNSFEICWKGVLSEEENEEICYVLCLPLVSLKRTSHGSSEFICFMIGFTSGYLRVYTEAGCLLLSQIFHDTPITEIVCSTFDRWAHLSHGGAIEQKDEVTILHQDSTLVVVDGFSLFQTMRACRSQLAMAAASGNPAQEPPPLACRKWRLNLQAETTSHVCMPMGELTPFHRIMNYSLDHVDGQQGNVTLYATVGNSPFVAYYYADEGNTRPILSYVASVVANKLTKQASALISAASGWIKWGAQTATGSTPPPSEEVKKPPPKIAPSTALERHSGLPDTLRRGSKIVLAPGKRGLAALSDSLGRVCLVDLNTRSILRMWKGYRDAEVGFIRTYDDTPSHHRTNTIRLSGTAKKLALFIAIYAPRRGILEIWSCIHGPRVGAFNISKHDRLLFPGHGMLGMNLEKSLGSQQMLQCCILTSEGNIKDIFIPFHLALSDSKSNKAHDVHLLKKIAQMLHTKNRAKESRKYSDEMDTSKDGEEILKLITEMRLCSIQKQALLKFLHTKRIGSTNFTKCISLLTDKYANGSKKEEKDFVRLLQVKMDLIEIYKEISELNVEYKSPNRFTEWDSLGSKLASDLQLSEHESEIAATLMKKYKDAAPSSTVRFQSQLDLSIDVAEFLACFSIEKDEELGYKVSIDEKKSQLLGSFLFHSSLFGEVNAEQVVETIKKIKGICTQQKELLQICLLHWQEYECDVYGNHKKLEELIKRLDWNTDEDSDASLLWFDELKQQVISTSRYPLAAYITTLVIRSHLLSTKQQNNQQTESKDESAENTKGAGGEKTEDKLEWETLCLDTEKWNGFMKQMEDSLALNTCIMLGNKILQTPTTSKDASQQSTTADLCPLVSVHDLLTNGTGHPSELIASVLSKSHIHPSLVGMTSSLRGDCDVIGEDDLNEHQQKFIDELIYCRNHRFPFSLSPNSLHSHCFWEEMVKWNKNLQDLTGMKRGLVHLRLIACQPQVQRGLALMAWSTFIHKRILALGKLVDKVGKAPKERLCVKEVGVKDRHMSEFCECAIELLQIIADADSDQFPQPATTSNNQLIHVHGSSEFQSVESNWLDIGGKESIVEMARKQSDVNYKLIQHLMNLIFVLRSTMEFSLRGVKPMSQLFDTFGRKAFEHELTSYDVHLPDCDVTTPAVISARKKFINNIIEAAVLKMAQQLHDVGGEVNLNDLKEWVVTCIHMSGEFNLSKQQAHIHYIDLLYNHGLDELGAEELEGVSDPEVVASKLLLTIGQRFAFYLKHISPDVGVLIFAQMPTRVSTFINSQELDGLRKADVPLKDTLELAMKVSSILPEVDGEDSLAYQVVEALQAALDA